MCPINPAHVASIIKRCRSICLTQAEVRDKPGCLLVHCLSKQLLNPTLQPIGATARKLGLEALPPKFLRSNRRDEVALLRRRQRRSWIVSPFAQQTGGRDLCSTTLFRPDL